MKFQITMKDPDGAYDSLDEATKESLAAIEEISEEERDALFEARRDTLATFADKWMTYGEYITVEFDTEAGTATVVKK